jgi:hypothetical protein
MGVIIEWKLKQISGIGREAEEFDLQPLSTIAVRKPCAYKGLTSMEELVGGSLTVDGYETINPTTI